MRILFTTTRGIGHFRPMLPFARTLSARGHAIRIAARDDLSDRITQEGFAHVVLDGPAAEDLKALWAAAAELPADEQVKFYIAKVFAGVIAQAALPGVSAAVKDWQPDLIVRESMEFAGLIAAQGAGIPHARIEVHSGATEDAILGHHEAVDALRRMVALTPDKGASLHAEPAFTAFPAMLEDTARQYGLAPFRCRTLPLLPISPPEPEPGGGAPLLYMTFGTVTAEYSTARFIFRTALEAVADLPVRVLMTTGTDLDAELLGPVPANVTVRAFVPHAEVLPQAAAVVCHGGSGTLLGVIAAGLPMVVTPLFADQPDNARSVEATGLGLSVPNPDPASLRAAILRVLEDPRFRKTARRAAADLATMPSIEDAVERMLALSA